MPSSTPKMPTVLAVVLAGGRSQRMKGVKKSQINLAGMRLIEHCVSRLSQQNDDLVISANEDVGTIPAALAIFPDTVEGFAGPLAGILAAMRWAQARNKYDYVVSVAVDTPFFPDDLLQQFLAISLGNGSRPVIARSAHRIHPTFGLWSVALADALEDFLLAGERKMLVWADRCHSIYADFQLITMNGQSIDPFFNINFPEDIQRAEELSRLLIKVDKQDV
nr:molybdenum cofactor guanylyltransferase MobA [uncultured Cohaesibacter sp.]